MESASKKLAWSLATVGPWLCVVLLTLHYGVDVPLVDQWAMPPLLEKSYAGTLTLHDLFAQYAEHRLLFPRLITIGLARLSGWNVRWELVANLLLATLTGALLIVLLRRALAASGSRMPVWGPALFSLLTFSLCQWENWLWGGQIHFFLNVLCVGGGVLALWNTRRAGSFVCAILLGVIATFSLASGLIFWWIGLFVIAIDDWPVRLRWRRIAIWSAAELVVYAIYFYDFIPFAPAGERLNPILSPVIFSRYLLTFLGSPAVSFSGSAFPPRDSGVAALVGLASVLLFAVVLLRIWREGAPFRRSETPFVALGAYAFLAGASAAVGRGKFGTPQAMAPRYTTVSLLWWFGLCGCLLILMSIGGAVKNEHMASPKRQRAAAWLTLAIAALILTSSLVCIPIFSLRWRLLEPTRGAVLENGPDRLLARLHPNVQLVHNGIAILRVRRLSVFRDMPDRLHVRRVAVPLKTFAQILAAEEPVVGLSAGEKRSVRMRVTNPTNENWSALGDGTGMYSVRLSYHWLREDGTATVVDGKRTLLPADLGPNETVRLKACLAAPSTGGRFVLVWTLVQENVNWFDAAGTGALKVDVNVLP